MPEVAVTTASALGGAHRRKHAGNEDAAGWRTDARSTALGVADGHSDPRCIRADRGARFAVQAVIELPHRGTGAGPHDLVTAWNGLVAEDAERDALGSDAGPVRLAYGTTVIACWITDAGLRLLQIGDGVALVATAGGVVRPIPPDERESFSETDSLASETAAARARVARLPLAGLPIVVCLSTDGVDGAYPDAGGLLRAVEELRTLAIEQGAAAVTARLDPWVHEAAAVSGDDATVAIAIVTATDDGRGR